MDSERPGTDVRIDSGLARAGTQTRMEAHHVLSVITLLAGAGVTCWLDGGWAVDALVGRQTRPHEDLDLLIATTDVAAAIEALQVEGFSIDVDERPCSFTMCTGDGQKVDLHPVRWDRDGGGVQAQPNNSTWTYPARGFSGVGSIAGTPVKCLTAETQIICHAGYELDAGDLSDLRALRNLLENESPEVRAHWRDLVRQGYDVVSVAYRPDDGSDNRAINEDTARYGGWVEELARVLAPTATVLDLGCGAGVPAGKQLVSHGFDVVGVDISAVQIERARRLVPGATFIQADMATWDVEPASFDGVLSLYALIQLPLEDQRSLFPRIRRWLRPGGHLMAIVGDVHWTGLENYLGAPMFWEHADAATYLDLMAACGLSPVWHRFVPEGDTGHTLVLARAI